jgi:hypothetical protein
MIGSWIKRKTEQAILKSASEDLERFMQGLQGQTADELAMLRIGATELRINMRQTGNSIDSVMDLPGLTPDEDIRLSMLLPRTIKGFQKEKMMVSAACAMVWLHSLRAYTIPELRLRGREMWQQLEKGNPSLESALVDYEAATGNPLPPDVYDEVERVPIGLEPGGAA